MRRVNDINKVNPGDEVRIWWNGFPGVRKDESGWWVQVTKVNRKRLVVIVDGIERSIRLDHVVEVLSKNKRWHDGRHTITSSKTFSTFTNALPRLQQRVARA